MNKAIITLAILTGLAASAFYISKKIDKQAGAIRPSMAITARTFSPEPLVSPYSVPSLPDVHYEQMVAKGETIPTNTPVIPKQPTVWDGLGDIFAPFHI